MRYYGTTDEKHIGVPAALKLSSQVERLTVLYKQEGWVALDEMDYYLRMISSTGHAVAHAPLRIPHPALDDDLFLIVKQWFLGAEMKCHAHSQVASAILVQGHWFPVILRGGLNCIKVLCTQDGLPWIQVGLTDRSHPPQFQVLPIFGVFLNDCGFQCAAWLTAAVMHKEFEKVFDPFHPDTACTWRQLFEEHLKSSGKGRVLVRPCHLPVGGASGVDLRGQVQQLLEQHGVAGGQSGSRTDSVLEKLGRQQVAYAMRSQTPWKDLKALANHAVPKLQLVLASELQQVIETRLSSDQPFGARKQKAKQVQRAKVEITPEDIDIPDGIFKEGEALPIAQITLADIGPTARGVIVVASHQTAPYIRMQKPVSSGGLGLLVLDHHAVSLHGVGEIIRFPARCTATGEPILLTAKLVQIGSAVVSRIHVEGKPKVDEVANHVLKIMVYRDELPADWDKFRQRPVKWLVTEFPELQGKGQEQQGILDCWDRQFLTGKLERTRPATAEVFAAVVRVAQVDLHQLLSKSGHGPAYFEPRNDEGTTFLETYRVTWLNRHDREAAVLAKQSTERWSCLVRAGERYGLRVMKVDAEFVHKQHRPLTPFLDGQLALYTAGPFPFGATRQSLAKIFSSWGWAARPLQPKGRTADKSGMIWEVQASCAPEFDVYQLDHADVLLSEVPRKPKSTGAQAVDVQGSARTIAALTKQREGTKIGADPWEVNKETDPWGTYTPISKQARHWDSKPSAEKMEKRILQTIDGKYQSLLKQPPGLCPAEDARIKAMEERMAKIESTVSTNQTTQEQQHAEVTASVQGLQAQVTHQGSELQRHFDQRMQEQLNQIERLLTGGNRRE